MCPFALLVDMQAIKFALLKLSTRLLKVRLDFRRFPGPVFDPSAGSFSRTAAGTRA